MSPHVIRGHVIFRHWDQETGLDEVAEAFASLDELFALCLRSADTRLIDRVVIEGQAEDGTQCTVTLRFQSVVVSNSDADQEH